MAPIQPAPLPDDDVSTRYGRGNPLARRIFAVVTILFVSLALVWLAWAIWFQSTPDVQSKLQGFDIIDDHNAQARIVVQLSAADVKANCLVKALGINHDTVGEVTLPVTGTTKRMVHTIDIRTERRTNAVELVGCTTERQQRPR